IPLHTLTLSSSLIVRWPEPRRRRVCTHTTSTRAREKTY
uniref:Uncharacterized protein n=1 Tax=Pristionchus pacificus TaxID=54126 RepID=A0A2A6CV89_PRIPA